MARATKGDISLENLLLYGIRNYGLVEPLDRLESAEEALTESEAIIERHPKTQQTIAESIFRQFCDSHLSRTQGELLEFSSHRYPTTRYQDREELCLEAVYKTNKCISRLEIEGDVIGSRTAILTKSLHRLVISFHRKKQLPRQLIENIDCVQLADTEAERRAVILEQLEWIEEALQTLPPKHRMAIILKYRDELSSINGARVIGMSQRSFNRLVQEATKLISEYVSRKYRDE